MSRKILVVEDDKDLQKVICQGLSAKKIECDVAENGAEALEVAIKFMPDLIILDIMMPVMDGYECCEKLREMKGFEETPIIFLTARGDDWDVLTGYIKGCDAYLKKPFSLDALADEISRILN